MDDKFGFPAPVELLPSLTWEQIISKENHWSNSQIPPHLMRSSTNDGRNSPCFKTQICWRFKFRSCPNGDSCKFAHSVQEIRRPHRVSFPRQDCNSNSHTQNPSNPNPYGRFKQNEDQKLHRTKLYNQHSENWKRKSCPHWSTSRRCLGRESLAHGDEELKKLGVDSWEAGGKSVRPAPFKVSPGLSERKISQQPGSSVPRVTDLTLKKCKHLYGDWID